MPFPRHGLLVGHPPCRQMRVSRHRLLFGGPPCRQMLVFRHRLPFGGPPCRQMPVSRHRRRPTVMVGGYGTPLRWALCNGPPRGGRCLVTFKAVTFRSDACSAVACSLSSSALTPNRVLGELQLSTRQCFVAERPILVLVDVKSRAECVPAVNAVRHPTTKFSIFPPPRTAFGRQGRYFCPRNQNKVLWKPLSTKTSNSCPDAGTRNYQSF